MSESEKSTSFPFAVALQNFASQWFLIPQGTGIIAIVLHQLDYQFQDLRIVADIFWLLTIASLLLMLAAYCTRILLYPKQVRAALQSNISEAACLSCIVIAFTTIIIMTALTSVRLWSSKWGTVVFVLWWINVALAVASSIGTPYAFAHIEHPGTTKVTPTIFMPTVCGATTAVGGAIICRYGALTNHEQVPVIIVSYLLLGLVLPLTIAYDALFLARSFEGNLPNEQQVYQIFILCGPLSQGSYALQVLGDVVSRGPFAGYGRGLFLTQSAAMPIAYASEFAGLIMWGYATFWWGFAIVSVVFDFISKAKAKGGIRKMEFSLSAWSVVFPWGAYTNAAVQLGVLMDSETFKVWSTTLLIMLIIIFLCVAVGTLHGVFTGKLLCLSEGWKRKVGEEPGEARKSDDNEKGEKGSESSGPETKRIDNESHHTEMGNLNGGLIERLTRSGSR